MKIFEKDKNISKFKKLEKKILILKTFFAILFASLFIVLTKVKITPIIGTESKFSASVMFGPVISKFIGIGFGSGSIIGAHIFGIIFGIYKIKSLLSFFTFAPIIFAGIYFAKIFKSEKKIILFPLISIIAFILHPIGREVWFYSLFWLIPITISFGERIISNYVKNNLIKTYIYSLGTAFVDHSIGSILFLYFLNIPKEAWITAIPLTMIERLIIAAGITFSYFSILAAIKVLKEISAAIGISERILEKENPIVEKG
jgi:hypothetical protein